MWHRNKALQLQLGCMIHVPSGCDSTHLGAMGRGWAASCHTAAQASDLGWPACMALFGMYCCFESPARQCL